MRLNWKVRFNKKNIKFWVQVAVSVIIPVLAYFGLTAQDFTTWEMVGKTIAEAFKNPYVVGLMLVAFGNAVIDPTTKGVGDSENALTYTEPK